jgi:hypothetical protein
MKGRCVMGFPSKAETLRILLRSMLHDAVPHNAVPPQALEALGLSQAGEGGDAGAAPAGLDWAPASAEPPQEEAHAGAQGRSMGKNVEQRGGSAHDDYAPDAAADQALSEADSPPPQPVKCASNCPCQNFPWLCQGRVKHGYPSRHITMKWGGSRCMHVSDAGMDAGVALAGGRRRRGRRRQPPRCERRRKRRLRESALGWRRRPRSAQHPFSF